jgi:hypothetical protein
MRFWNSGRKPRMHKKFRPNRTEGQPVGQMNSPQGEDRAALVEKGLRFRLLASLGTPGRCTLSHRPDHRRLADCVELRTGFRM